MKQIEIDSEKVKDIQVVNRNLDSALATASKILTTNDETINKKAQTQVEHLINDG